MVIYNNTRTFGLTKNDEVGKLDKKGSTYYFLVIIAQIYLEY